MSKRFIGFVDAQQIGVGWKVIYTFPQETKACDGGTSTAVDLSEYPKFKGGAVRSTIYGTRDAVRGGSVPKRDDSGEDRDAKHRDDPPASPDPEKGPDDSPEDEAKGATMEGKLNRILNTVQERYGVELVLHKILMAHEDVQELLEEMDPSWYRESIGWRPAIRWYSRPWNPILQVDPVAKPGEVKLCFHTEMLLEKDEIEVHRETHTT